MIVNTETNPFLPLRPLTSNRFDFHNPRMTNPIYTERDLVLKGSSVEKLLVNCSRMGLCVQGTDAQKVLVKCIDLARYERRPVLCEELNLTVGWDEDRQEYCAVAKDVYDPGNLVSVLYERLISVEEDDAGIDSLIDAYLGVIEGKEKVSLLDVREKLKSLTKEMSRTLRLYQGDEFSESDLERLSEILDSSYFDPIAELLEGVLVTIAGN